MKKIFTIAAALLASFSLWATPVAELSFSEPTSLPEGYVYSTANTPIIATVGGKSAVYVTNGGGGQVVAACFSEDGLVAGQGKRWMGFETDSESSLVISVYSSQKVWTLYQSDGSAFATYTNVAKNTWEDWTIETLPAGQYILTAGSSQCYASAFTFTGGAPSTDPVESAEISGETACLVGASIELTCNAPKATSYQWSMNGAEIEGATAKKYTFAPSAAGEYSFTCAASNENNIAPVVAAAHVVSVIDPANVCGELIKATHVNKNTATVTGIVGGTADKSTQDNGKLGSNGHYFGVKLASGSFQVGDVVTIVASALNGGNTATIYADKTGAELLGSVAFDEESLTATYTLTASAEWIYLYRKDSGCNPSVASISVNRSCEASNNADVAEVRVNGVVVDADSNNELLYNYTLSALYSEPTVSIALTLAHPRATIKYGLDNPYAMSTPEAGSSRGQAFTIVAEDGVTEKTITVNVAKSATLSNNWFLSELSIDGYTLDPAFTPEVNSYTITKPYGAANPTESAIHAVTQHPGAHIDQITINPTNILIMVVAENGVSSNGYLIEIEEAAAKKDLLEARFSNNVHGYIANGNINVPYLAGDAQPVFESATFWDADGVPTVEMVGDNLVVTGIDGQQATYTITYIPVTPMEPNFDEITFDGNEIGQFIYSVYGWDAEKGIKFSKDVEEASNHRISEGKDRIFMALPKALSITLTSGSGANRPVKVWVNGSLVSSIKKTAASGATIQIPLDGSKANYLVIESDKNNGDAGFTKMQLEQAWATGLDNTEEAVKTVKFFENGQLIIMKNGVKYNAQGARL